MSACTTCGGSGDQNGKGGCSRCGGSGREPEGFHPYSTELEGIIKRHDDAVDALGAKVRVEVVVPLCRKFKLSFVVIQGDFWFMKKKYTKEPRDWHNAPHYSNSKYLNDLPPGALDGYEDISDAAKKALEPVLDLLNTDVSWNNPLGYHVESVE